MFKIVCFLAYKSDSINGQGTITGWTEAVDIGLGSATTAGTFTPGTGLHATTTAGLYFYFGSFRCAQGSACDCTMRQTGTRVAAFVSCCFPCLKHVFYN
jgi:hypothetical protein